MQQVDVLLETLTDCAVHFERAQNAERVCTLCCLHYQNVLKSTSIELLLSIQVDSAIGVLKELLALEADIRAHANAFNHLSRTHRPTVDSQTDFAALVEQRCEEHPVECGACTQQSQHPACSPCLHCMLVAQRLPSDTFCWAYTLNSNFMVRAYRQRIFSSTCQALRMVVRDHHCPALLRFTWRGWFTPSCDDPSIMQCNNSLGMPGYYFMGLVTAHASAVVSRWRTSASESSSRRCGRCSMLASPCRPALQQLLGMLLTRTMTSSWGPGPPTSPRTRAVPSAAQRCAPDLAAALLSPNITKTEEFAQAGTLDQGAHGDSRC